VALLLALAALPAMAEIHDRLFSSTKEFSIDGNAFRVEQSVEDDFSLIRRVLSRSGIDAPLPYGVGPSHPSLQTALPENTDGGVAPPLPLPSGLIAEHHIRLKSQPGTIDIAFGEPDVSVSKIRSRLSGSDWEFRETGKAGAPVVVATRNKGRETFIVILEEKTGKFLFVRKMD
jgi:hypothetical protein